MDFCPLSVRPEMCVLGAFRRQERAFPKSKSSKSGFDPKVKSPKMGLLITPRHFLQHPTLFWIQKTYKKSKEKTKEHVLIKVGTGAQAEI